ncbi:serine hydrolase [Candidatus Nomurabacteria bacterium]|nr:serine hydrolase [Candidatus Nomurabacteria bacterium]
MKNLMLNKIKNISNSRLMAFFLITGLVIGYFISFYLNNQNFNCYSNYYHYLNPRLACQDKPVIRKVAYLSLQNSVGTYLNEESSKGNLSDASVYFRDLENGPIFGINSNKLFISASLIKLPTVMTVLRLADQDDSLLQRKILYSQEIPSGNQDFAPAKKLVVGQSYTIDDLVARTLEYSDNAANELLVNELYKINPKEDLIFDTFRDLGLVVPGDVTKGDLSTQSYSSLFRLLYNASFLSKENSEKILTLLGRASFKEGLEAGVPQGIKVAGKFGERELDFVSNGKSTGHENELHDCGVIYYPNNPYLLCVMTKGQDFNVLAKIIAHVSEMVYAEVDSRKIE